MNESQLFFPTSRAKLIVMSVCTFSIYIFYWFYKNWKIQKETQGIETQPFKQTLCAPIFCYFLFKNILICAKKKDVHAGYSPGRLTLGFDLLIITLLLPFPISLMAFFLPVFALIPVQGVINSLNAKIIPDFKINNRFSVWNITAIVFGVLFWVVLILGIIIPAPSA